MAFDSVRIDPDAAGAALRAWEAAVAGVQRMVQLRAAAIQDAEGACPWGGDNGGPEFAHVYLAGAQTSGDAVRMLTDQLGQLGRDVGTALQASLASDEQQAAALVPARAELGFDSR